MSDVTVVHNGRDTDPRTVCARDVPMGTWFTGFMSVHSGRVLVHRPIGVFGVVEVYPENRDPYWMCSESCTVRDCRDVNVRIIIKERD